MLGALYAYFRVAREHGTDDLAIGRALHAEWGKCFSQLAYSERPSG